MSFEGHLASTLAAARPDFRALKQAGEKVE